MSITEQLLVLNSRISIYLMINSLDMGNRTEIMDETSDSDEKKDLIKSLKAVLKELNND